MNTIKNGMNAVVGEYLTPQYVKVRDVVNSGVEVYYQTSNWLNRQVETLIADRLPAPIDHTVMTVWKAIPEIVVVLNPTPLFTLCWGGYMSVSFLPIGKCLIAGNSNKEKMQGAINESLPELRQKLQKLVTAITTCFSLYALGSIKGIFIGSKAMTTYLFSASRQSLIALACLQYEIPGLSSTAPERHEANIEELANV